MTMHHQSRIPSTNMYNNFPWKPISNPSDSQRSFQESMDSGFSSSQGSLNAGSQKTSSASQANNSQDKLQVASEGSPKVPMQKLYNMYFGKKGVSAATNEGGSLVDQDESSRIQSTICVYLLKEILEKVVLLNDHYQQHATRQQQLLQEHRKASDEVEKKLSEQIEFCVEEIKGTHALLLTKIEKLENIIDEDNRQMAKLRQTIQVSKYQEMDCVVNHLRDTILAETRLILQTLKQATCSNTARINGVEGILTQSISALKEFVGNEIRLCKQLQPNPSPPRLSHCANSLPGGGDGNGGGTPVSHIYSGGGKCLSLGHPNIRQTPKMFATRRLLEQKRRSSFPDKTVVLASTSYPRGLRSPYEKGFGNSTWAKYRGQSPDVEMAAADGGRSTARFRQTPMKTCGADMGRPRRRIHLRPHTPSIIPTIGYRGQRTLFSPLSCASGSGRSDTQQHVCSVGQLEVIEGSSSQSSPTMSMNLLSLDF